MRCWLTLLIVGAAATSAPSAAVAQEAAEARATGGARRQQGGEDADVRRLAAELRAGRRVVLREIAFAASSDDLLTSSLPSVKRLAKAISAAGGTFVIEGHVDSTGDAAADQSLSERRATAVKARLYAEGVPATQVFAVGYGATRPAVVGRITRADEVSSKGGARIEVVRAQ